jgi:VanZ family protein
VRGSRAGRALVAASALVILALTLFPTGSAGGLDAAPLADRMASLRGLADTLVNILLFMPLGAAVAIHRRGVWWAVAAGAALSLGAEAAQLFIPGRYSSPWDVAANTLGAAAGAVAVRLAPWWLHPEPGRSRKLAAGAAVAAVLTLLGGSMLFHPAPRDGPLIGQWHHRYENRPHYSGRVLEATVAGIPTPPWEVDRSPEVLAHLFTGPVRVTFEVGAPPQGTAPLFALVAPEQEVLFEVLVSGTDLVVTYRMRARSIGLDQPELRLPGALAHLVPGNAARLEYRREGSRHCVALDGEQQCGTGFSAAHTWALLMYPVPTPLAAILPFLWVAALVFPAAFWSARPATATSIAVIAALALLAAPLVAPVLTPAWPELLAAVVGAVAGYACGQLARARPATAPTLPPGPSGHLRRNALGRRISVLRESTTLLRSPLSVIACAVRNSFLARASPASAPAGTSPRGPPPLSSKTMWHPRHTTRGQATAQPSGPISYVVPM